MPIAKLVPYVSAEEYLASEDASPVRREYVRGQVFAMAGGSAAHNKIIGNLHRRLYQHLRGSGCEAFFSDMRVQIQAIAAYYYPDVFVSCEPVDDQALFKSEPVLILEVLSESTKGMDRREKLMNYQLLVSLHEYALVHQKKRRVELYRRTDDDQWQLQVYETADAVVFESLPHGRLTMSMDEIYEGVQLDLAASADED